MIQSLTLLNYQGKIMHMKNLLNKLETQAVGSQQTKKQEPKNIISIEPMK